MNLTGRLQVTNGQVLNDSTTQMYALGTAAQDRFGRVYRYVQAGASALVVGNVIQSAAQVANHLNCGVAATAIGATAVTVTPGATAGAANLYAEGIAVISTTPGLGYSYGISGHAAITASTAFTLNLVAEDGVQVALTTSSKLDLQINPYKNVIQAPVTTLTGAVVGVAVYPIAAASYGWIQTWGMGGVLIDGTPAVGQSVSSPAAVAGGAAINSGTLQIIGSMLCTGVDTKVKPVFITIAP